jgi:hypothetical protein
MIASIERDPPRSGTRILSAVSHSASKPKVYAVAPATGSDPFRIIGVDLLCGGPHLLLGPAVDPAVLIGPEDRCGPHAPVTRS